MEYVDTNGHLNKIDISTPNLLRAAVGYFSLISIVIHLTLKFNAISYALMEPRKLPIIKAIPPPPNILESNILLPL